MRRALLLLIAALLGLNLFVNAGSGYAQKRKKHAKNTAAATDSSAEPDKVLYNRALEDIKHGRHEIGRLTLQTLINTYPDSEYLAKAKLGIADSFYKEGGTANMAQAIAGYKDFIVFFPFLPEASYAQLQVGMAHYRQMEKPDRDRTHARAAEDEFQTFLQKYGNDPLAPEAEQHLREVQEVLAEGNFRIGNYYYLKQSYRAAAARLLTLTSRYPLYSRSDRALWMLGAIFERGERKDIAANYYAKIVRNYPLSGLADDARKKLTALGAPIPQPDPQALARMQQERTIERPHVGVMHKATGILHSGPDVRTAARVGKPNLEPESTSVAGVDVLTPGGQNRLGGGPGTTAVVATVTPGSSTGSAATAGAESAPAATGTESAPAPDATAPPATGAGTVADPAKAEATPAENAAGSGAAAPDGASAPPTNVANPPDSFSKTGDDKKSADKKKESTNKKKKGLRKIIPF
ncbi:MAG: outer membrane protein assembly factor BamD [Acidobacteriia bacterium]|nr:outer membrane protein assembly factor BamD [Terriglobia bacterium]